MKNLLSKITLLISLLSAANAYADFNFDANPHTENYRQQSKELLEKIKHNLSKKGSSYENVAPDFIGEVSNQKTSSADGKINGNINGQLFLFISSSMPRQALENYFYEAKKYNATILIRGFINDSLKETTQFFAKIDNGTSALIDPDRYTKFNINAVPAIVLVQDESECINQSCTPRHDRISGNISIAYALESFAKEGDLRNLAQNILRGGKK